MYYPKSQIKTNLYTNGGEYILSTTKESYVGYFYEISNGNKFTGSPSDNTPNTLLTRINPDISSNNPFNPNQKRKPNQITGVNSSLDDPINSQYPPVMSLPIYELNDNNFKLGRSLPLPIQTRPTKKDYDLGVFSRYIVKKNNENTYIEINKEQFIKLQNRDEDVAWDLYTPKEILWQIKGDKTQTYTTNKNIIELVENRDKWYGFTQWFKDRFLKYYIGKDFHVMPDGSIMEGKTHEDGKNLNSIKLPKNTSTQSNSTTSNNPSGGGY